VLSGNQKLGMHAPGVHLKCESNAYSICSSTEKVGPQSTERGDLQLMATGRAHDLGDTKLPTRRTTVPQESMLTVCFYRPTHTRVSDDAAMNSTVPTPCTQGKVEVAPKATTYALGRHIDPIHRGGVLREPRVVP